MELSEIWVGIIIPLITGPGAYLMMIRNDYVERKYRRAREKYEEERDSVYLSLKKFYWPVYLNPLCIEQYSYSLPSKNKFRYESISSEDLSNNSNDFFELCKVSPELTKAKFNEVDLDKIYEENINNNLNKVDSSS